MSDQHYALTASIRHAWALVPRRERRQLQLISLYGLLIAGLDTLALLLVYALINLLSSQGATGIGGTVIDTLHLNPSEQYRTALILLSITASLFVLRSVLSVIGLWLSLGIVYSAEAKIMARLLIGHAHAPQLMRLERNSSETLRTVLDSVDKVMNGVVFSSVSLVANAAVALAVLVGLFLASPSVAITISVYFTVVAVGWVYGVRNRLAHQGRRAQELQRERYQLVLQGIAATKELQLRGRSVIFAEEANAATRGILAAMRVGTVIGMSLRYVLETSLVFGAVIVVAAAGVTGGQASVLPAIGLVLAGAFRFLPALNQMLFLTNQVQFSGPAIGFAEKEVEIYGAFADEEEDESEALEPPLRLQKELRLENVGFSYPTRPQPVLRDVSLVVRPGESLGIVGPTGTGKSTLLDIILGMLEPERGSITVDGAPLGERRGAWQRSIGYVPQDVYLTDDSLRANVALGWLGEEIDDDRVVEAIRLAGLEEVVAALPEGFDTVIGERGVRLSGGQRQRVGIARALYTEPSVLVLDEATSNLDQTTERRIVDTLASLRGGVTTIVVTHRTASVRHCDQILYLEGGRVRSTGTFDEIRAAVPEFDEPQPAKLASGQ